MIVDTTSGIGLGYDAQKSWADYLAGPQKVGFCFHADGRRARFPIDEGPKGDALLDKLAKNPERPVRPARPWGINGWSAES